ncbi:nitrile hydratase subunit beta [uncultured Ruegeria sp.]|uniref:nitrile hydratase subunit beta n=1 Tax=uncultured Ruegeria sp. TaxID=259304 RepID=UPI002637FE46|nr:nitrile hydratase subunit beta [uncultured Ruegeria sp.]
MDGIHDLGGVQGFGPIPLDKVDSDFRDLKDWEKRMWGLSSSPIAPGITIDWFRHGIERMVPEDYLSFAYFNKWCANYFMFMLDDGAITIEDIKRGHMKVATAPPKAKSVADVLAEEAESDFSFERQTTQVPKFTVGQTVLTRQRINENHTRLPRYARGAQGRVISHHGAHALPAKGAQGIEACEHLYSVVFRATDFWGDEANPRDEVTLDLWESYLVPI